MTDGWHSSQFIRRNKYQQRYASFPPLICLSPCLIPRKVKEVPSRLHLRLGISSGADLAQFALNSLCRLKPKMYNGTVKMIQTPLQSPYCTCNQHKNSVSMETVCTDLACVHDTCCHWLRISLIFLCFF